jgi:hypothetical protein
MPLTPRPPPARIPSPFTQLGAMPDISGIPAYHRIDDHEGFSLDEGFSFNKRKILRDHVLPFVHFASPERHGRPSAKT